jgi:hypothetical protein
MFDEPNAQAGSPTGGSVCGPIMKEIIRETLNYLKVNPLKKVVANRGLLGQSQ